VGGPGTAKTATVQQWLSRFPRDDHSSKTINFSYLTTPGIFQQALEGSVEKRQGRTYGPPSGRTLTVFIDDLSMPAVNEWGDQVTNELVRQLLEQAGFYSLEKPIGDMKTVVDTRWVGPGAAVAATIAPRLPVAACPDLGLLLPVLTFVMPGRARTQRLGQPAQKLVP
jgi:dynein heavy chain